MYLKQVVGFTCIFFLVNVQSVCLAQKTAQEDVLLQVLQSEMQRNMKILGKKDIPVYLLTYRVEEQKAYAMQSTFGNLDYSNNTSKKILTIQVRVGDMKLDNYHELREEYSDYFAEWTTDVPLPITFDKKALEQVLWRETDKAYREAVKRLEKVIANVAVKVELEDKAPDFSMADVNVYFEPPITFTDFNKETWQNKIMSYSSIFKAENNIIKGESYLNFSIVRKYIVNSEGTSVVFNNSYCHLFINGETQADDGMELPLYKSYFEHTPEKLPVDNIVIEDAKKLIQTLIALRKAPVVDTYTGPALLSNDASGVFFHEIFGHRVEGKRLKEESDGQTFKKKVNQEVLNTHLSVVFDPTIKYYKGIPLNGSFLYDDEGVKGQKVVVVDKGILKDFLMTRTPIDSFPKSNGHARAQAGFQPVSRQSNLIVETDKPYTDQELRQMLIQEAKKQGKEYGYYFAKVQGGFTLTGRFIPNSFNVLPLEVYRIYVDGRPDELVRGVDLVGTPLTMFSHVEAVGNTSGNFAGTCGAESGGVPAGCCSPALFVSQIEMQKQYKSQSKPPLIERANEDKNDLKDFETIVFQAMQDEMQRDLAQLKIEDLASPCFISYLVTDAQVKNVESSLGSIILSESKPYRNQQTQILVGDKKFNNLNYYDENSLIGSYENMIPISLNNSYQGVRNGLWLTSDSKYKDKAENFESKKSSIKQQNLSKEQTDIPDFADVEIQTNIINKVLEPARLSDLETVATELSKLFINYPNFNESWTKIYEYQANTYYLSSEGMKYKQPFNLLTLRVYAEAVTSDGQTIMDYFDINVNKYSDLPNIETLKNKVIQMANLLEQIRTAPVLEEAYSGPVMFTGQAVGEIVAQTFVSTKKGLLAERKPITTTNTDFINWYGKYIPQGNQLEQMIGKKVISRDLSVTALDGKTTYNNIPLIGAYQVDAEGVKVASEMPLIQEGVLRNLVNDRIPTATMKTSNGHKRLSLSRGNITTSLCIGVIELSGKNKMSYDKLKKKLIALAKEEDYEYAYIIPKLVSSNAGVSIRDFYMENNYYKPVYVIRVSVKDGSETIMRMAKVSALNMKSFKYVMGVSSQQQVYNTLLFGKGSNDYNRNSPLNLSGTPCSLIVPEAILFQELEVEKNPNVILNKPFEVPNPLLEK